MSGSQPDTASEQPEAGETHPDFVTRDLSLAAFLAERGLILRKAGKDRKTGYFHFVLEDPHGDAERLKVEWSNSCCFKHEKRLQSIKSVMRSGDGRGW